MGGQQELLHGWAGAAELECGRLLVLGEVGAGGTGQSQSAEASPERSINVIKMMQYL